MNFLKKELKTEHIDNCAFVYENNQILSNPDISYREIEESLSHFEKKDKKKLNYVAVELVQNVIKHHDKTYDKNVDSVFAIHRKENRILMFTGNVINKIQFEKLKKQIDKINSLNEIELQDFYKFTLNEIGYTEKGGAGLGLIDITRKSKTKLTYAVKKISDDYIYFYNIVFYTLFSGTSQN
jgi:hypothetical protein